MKETKKILMVGDAVLVDVDSDGTLLEGYFQGYGNFPNGKTGAIVIFNVDRDEKIIDLIGFSLIRNF